MYFMFLNSKRTSTKAERRKKSEENGNVFPFCRPPAFLLRKIRTPNDASREERKCITTAEKHPSERKNKFQKYTF